MTLYNSIGAGYNNTRQPDLRIVEQLVSLLDLPPESTIADVGAGTGNYSNAIADRGHQVIAIEPSEVMQSQRKPHDRVSWLTAAAEQIPLPDNSVDGVLVMLALHHFNDLSLGIEEIARITKGKIVIFAFEPDKIPQFWLSDYFPYFLGDTSSSLSTQELARSISQTTRQEVKTIPFLLPANLSDLFAASGWCKPEIYLDAKVRSGISTFAKMPTYELNIGLERLAAEIDNGTWLQKYGHLLKLKNYDAGYRIMFSDILLHRFNGRFKLLRFPQKSRP